jgi:stage V sporulation protein S
MNVIKVSANSRTAAVAGAIAGVMREHLIAEVQSIGAGAVNQAVKAIILAKGYLINDGINIVCVPEFVDVDIDGKVRTAIKITVTHQGDEPVSLPEETPEGDEVLETPE